MFLEEPRGLPIEFEVGRLDFEDDRLWWWDEDLDAVRIAVEWDELEIAAALARELAPARSGQSYIDPDDNQVLRWINEISWDYHDDHTLQFFILVHDDQSRKEKPGDRIRLSREDESDADLLWLGARAAGALQTENRGIFGYWLDLGWVTGDDRIVELADEDGDDSEEDAEEDDFPPLRRGEGRVEEISDISVEGWAMDLGATWLWDTPCEPRFTLGYAMGSGDSTPGDRRDRSFRQTGLHGNEPGFGGVQRFQGYGEFLDPELSNLSIITFGVGCTLFENSSIDLVFHDYRLIHPADSLRDAQIDLSLNEQDKEVGQGIDLILALEEWDRVELELSISAFRTGRAFGANKHQWHTGGYLACRIAF